MGFWGSEGRSKEVFIWTKIQCAHLLTIFQLPGKQPFQQINNFWSPKLNHFVDLRKKHIRKKPLRKSLVKGLGVSIFQKYCWWLKSGHHQLIYWYHWSFIHVSPILCRVLNIQTVVFTGSSEPSFQSFPDAPNVWIIYQAIKGKMATWKQGNGLVNIFPIPWSIWVWVRS